MNRDSIVVFEEIGEGGACIVEEVWPARDATESVARKRLKAEARRVAEDVRRFEREVRILSTLSHPNIISIIHSELEGDDPWFLMPLAVGNIEKEIPVGGMSHEQIRRVITHVLDALEYAHDQGVTHRDLKPRNILRMPDGRVMVSDFGLGKRFTSSSVRLTITGIGRGTEGYAAPEQWRDFARVDRRADIYGLGATLFEMTTGKSPLGSDPTAVPLAYQRAVRKCCAYDPDQRYQSVAELRAVLKEIWRLETESGPSPGEAVLLLEAAAFDPEARAELVGAHLRNPEYMELYAQTLPRWSSKLLETQLQEGVDEFKQVVAAVCRQATGNVDFDYLDVIASFLRRVYEASSDPDLRDLILTELLRIGEEFDRFYVGRVFATLVKRARTGHEVGSVLEVLQANSRGAAWVAPYVTQVGAAMQTLEVVEKLKDQHSGVVSKDAVGAIEDEELRSTRSDDPGRGDDKGEKFLMGTLNFLDRQGVSSSNGDFTVQRLAEQLELRGWEWKSMSRATELGTVLHIVEARKRLGPSKIQTFVERGWSAAAALAYALEAVIRYDSNEDGSGT